MTTKTKTIEAPVENLEPKPAKLDAEIGEMRIVAHDIVVYSGGSECASSSHTPAFAIERMTASGFVRVVGDELGAILKNRPAWLTSALRKGARREWEILDSEPPTREGLVRFGDKTW